MITRTATEIGWIGEIPQDWRLKPLKHIAEFANGMAFKPSDWTQNGTPIIRIENLNGGDDFNCYLGLVEPRYIVGQGDLLFGWSGNRGTSFGPFVWTKDGEFYLNQHIFKVCAKGCSPGWLYWCLKAVTHYVEEEAHGIIGMVHVTKGKLGAIKVPVPSRAEQEFVANFLDRETTKIDGLIAKQTEFLTLLDEHRRALVTEAVTKGLETSVSIMETGDDFLPRIPAHWQLVQLRYLVASPLAYGANEAGDQDVEKDPRYVRITDVREDGSLRAETRRSLPFAIAFPYLLRDGDVLLARSGATVGKSFLYRPSWGMCCFAGYLIRARCQPNRLDANFLPPRCFAWVATVSSNPQPMFLGSAESRFSVPA